MFGTVGLAGSGKIVKSLRRVCSIKRAAFRKSRSHPNQGGVGSSQRVVLFFVSTQP